MIRLWRSFLGAASFVGVCALVAGGMFGFAAAVTYTVKYYGVLGGLAEIATAIFLCLWFLFWLDY